MGGAHDRRVDVRDPQPAVTVACHRPFYTRFTAPVRQRGLLHRLSCPGITTVFLPLPQRRTARGSLRWRTSSAGRSRYAIDHRRSHADVNTHDLIASSRSASSAADPVRANSARPALTQDPPVIPRALTKRQGSRPAFRPTELFFGTATPGDGVSEERFLAFLDAEVTRSSHGFDAQGARPVHRANGVTSNIRSSSSSTRPSALGIDKKIEEIRRLYEKQFQQERTSATPSARRASF